MFQCAFVCSPFTSLKSVHDCHAELSFKHKRGSYISSVGSTVIFLTVKDPLDVVPKPVMGLQEASLLGTCLTLPVASYVCCSVLKRVVAQPNWYFKY